jgi:hypothetical protein
VFGAMILHAIPVGKRAFNYFTRAHPLFAFDNDSIRIGIIKILDRALLMVPVSSLRLDSAHLDRLQDHTS